MAKKSVTAPAAASAEVPKQSLELKLNIRGKLEFFWDYAELAWLYGNRFQEQLAATSPYITKEFIAAQVALINETKALPNNEVRSSNNSRSLLSVKAKRQVLVELSNILDNAIRIANQNSPALVTLERKAAGIVAFREASTSNYSAVSSFVTTANAYLVANGAGFVEIGAVPTDFVQRFQDAGTAFNTAKMNLSTRRQTSKDGTAEVALGVDKIKQQLRLMQDVGKQVFRYEPETLKFFTEDYLIEAVRSNHPAGVNGRATWPKEAGMDVAKPIAGVLVEVVGMEGKSAVTNRDGRYVIKQLSAGEHQLRFSGENIETNVQLFTLEAGVNRRLNVTLQPASVQQSREEALNKALTESLNEVAAPVLLPSGNGVHV